MSASLSLPNSRRVGAALVAYGLVGLVLAVALAAAGVMAALGLGDSAARLDADRVELVATVSTTATLVDTVADTLDTARPGLDRVTTSAGRLASLADQISATADTLAGRLDIQVLGVQPFAGMSDEVRGISAQTRGLSEDLSRIAPAVTAASEGSAETADGLRALGARLSTLGSRLDSLGTLEAYGRWLTLGVALAVLLDLWLAIPAAAAIVVGRRVLRR